MTTVLARGLVKSYGAVQAVAGLDLTVGEGEVFGMLGPNGAGKTTTVKMICGMARKSGGDLLVFGLDPDRHLREIQHRLGVMPQDDNLDPDLSPRQNLEVHAGYFRLCRGEAASRATQLLEFVQLVGHADVPVRTLSGGMRRRLLLARALINRPALVLLDEPTVGLDPQARLAVWSKILALRQQGVSIILTTHSMEEAERLCDRVAIVDHGRIVAEGAPRDLIARHVPREVLEVRAEDGLPDPALWPGVRVERSQDTLYLYADDVGPIAHNLAGDGRTILRRRSNLEDVFLTLTGREMRE